MNLGRAQYLIEDTLFQNAVLNPDSIFSLNILNPSSIFRSIIKSYYNSIHVGKVVRATHALVQTC